MASAFLSRLLIGKHGPCSPLAAPYTVRRAANRDRKKDGHDGGEPPQPSVLGRPDLPVCLKRTVAVTLTQKRKLAHWAGEASRREKLNIGVSEIVRRLLDRQAVYALA